MKLPHARLFTITAVLAACTPAVTLASDQSPTHRLAGVVVDGSGAAVSQAEVTATRAAALRPVAVRSDDSGRFELMVPGAGTWTVSVVRAGFVEWVGTVPVPVHDLRVALVVAGIEEAVTVTGAAAADETLRLPMLLKETPRALSVIDADRFRAQNFRTVTDALGYVPGMAVNSYRAGSYHFYARGYRMGPDETRVDGFAGINAGGRYGASLFGVEQAVVLRGPAGLLYGAAGSPGGFINLVTKKPQALASTRVDLRAGGYAGQSIGLGNRTSGGVDFDSTGPLTSGGRVLYRALASTERMAYFTDTVDDRNAYGNASLTVKLDAAGHFQLTPMVQWTRFNRPPGGGIVVSPSTSLLTNDGVSGPINTDDLSPLSVNLSAGRNRDEVFQAGVDFAGAVTPRLRMRASYRGIGNNTSIDQFAPQVSTAAQRQQLVGHGLVSRIQTASETERRYHNADVNGTYELAVDRRFRSLLQAGVHARRASTRGTTATGLATAAQSPVDIYTGVATTPLVFATPSLTYQPWTDTDYVNTFVQNQTSIGPFVATVGLGYGQTRVVGQSARQGDVTPNAALVYNLRPEVSLYGSYSTSFNPVDAAAENLAGQRGSFSPSKGINYEGGAKMDFAGGRGSSTVSIFRTEISNALVQSGATDLNPNGARYYVEAGTRRSSGVELTADVRPVPSWTLTGSVSYVDAIYTGEGPASAAATLAIPGSRAEKTPEWSWSLWTRYDRPAGHLAGLGASLGVIWQGDRLGSNGASTPSAPDPLLFPAFTRVDAGVFYRLSDALDLGLNIENLFDELIFVNGLVGSSIEVASPRAVMLRVGYRIR